MERTSLIPEQAKRDNAYRIKEDMPISDFKIIMHLAREFFRDRTPQGSIIEYEDKKRIEIVEHSGTDYISTEMDYVPEDRTLLISTFNRRGIEKEFNESLKDLGIETKFTECDGGKCFYIKQLS